MPTKRYIVFGLGIILGILFIFSIIPVHFSDHYKIYDQYLITQPNLFPRQMYYYSTRSPEELFAIRRIIKDNRLSGCIVAGLPTACTDPAEQLQQYRRDCKRLNRYFKHNYLVIRINSNELPAWDDRPSWNPIIDNIKALAKFARKNGFVGIFVDTKDPQNLLWDPEWNNRYKTTSDDFASKVIYQRSREIIQAIENVFPEAQIIVYPLGINEPPLNGGTISAYAYWIHFTNGLFSTKHSKISLMSDHVYTAVTENIEYRTSINNQLRSVIDEKDHWRKKGSLSWLIRPNTPSEIWSVQSVATGIIALDIPSLNYQEDLAAISTPQVALYIKHRSGKYISVLEYLSQIAYTTLTRLVHL